MSFSFMPSAAEGCSSLHPHIETDQGPPPPPLPSTWGSPLGSAGLISPNTPYGSMLAITTAQRLIASLKTPTLSYFHPSISSSSPLSGNLYIASFIVSPPFSGCFSVRVWIEDGSLVAMTQRLSAHTHFLYLSLPLSFFRSFCQPCNGTPG